MCLVLIRSNIFLHYCLIRRVGQVYKPSNKKITSNISVARGEYIFMDIPAKYCSQMSAACFCADFAQFLQSLLGWI